MAEEIMTKQVIAEDEVSLSLIDGSEFTSYTDEAVAPVEERVAVSESVIEQLADAISMLVVDKDGTSLMEQTSGGWRFSMADTEKALEELLGKMAYVGIGTTESGQPCIDLGSADSAFKVRITNTDIQFMESSTVPASISNQALNIGKANVEDELQFGGFAWTKRTNGNMGLMWKGDDA